MKRKEKIVSRKFSLFVRFNQNTASTPIVFFAFFVKCEIFAKYFWRNFASLSLFCFIHLVKKCEISRTCRNSNKNFRFFSRKVSFAVNPRWNTQGGPGHSHPPAVILRKLKKHWSQTVQFFFTFLTNTCPSKSHIRQKNGLSHIPTCTYR